LEIQTARFGTINFDEDSVISFPRGILGFSDYKKFILLPRKDDSPFFWLQSVEDEYLAFVLMNPKLVMPDYRIEIAADIKQELEKNGQDPLDLMCIVTVPHDHPEKMTINLLGPIIINSNKKKAVQIVSTTSTYSHQHPVIPAENQHT